MSCRAYAKALHYKEEDFHRGPTSNNLEALISINNKLQQPDAAAGVLVFAKQQIKGDFVSLCVLGIVCDPQCMGSTFLYSVLRVCTLVLFIVYCCCLSFWLLLSIVYHSVYCLLLLLLL